jgi:hypothetical protein
MADLIDGYCRLISPSHASLWTRKGNSLHSFLHESISSFFPNVYTCSPTEERRLGDGTQSLVKLYDEDDTMIRCIACREGGLGRGRNW